MFKTSFLDATRKIQGANWFACSSLLFELRLVTFIQTCNRRLRAKLKFREAMVYQKDLARATILCQFTKQPRIYSAWYFAYGRFQGKIPLPKTASAELEMSTCLFTILTRLTGGFVVELRVENDLRSIGFDFGGLDNYNIEFCPNRSSLSFSVLVSIETMTEQHRNFFQWIGQIRNWGVLRSSLYARQLNAFDDLTVRTRVHAFGT